MKPKYSYSTAEDEEDDWESSESQSAEKQVAFSFNPKIKDARYSEEHDRYSFDVVVRGPFRSKLSLKDPLPTTNTVGTQVMMVRHSNGSGPSEYSDDYRRSLSSRFSKEDGIGAGDASSSSAWSAEELTGEKVKKPSRKPSKRRDAETGVKPRGYKDLDLKQPVQYLEFEMDAVASTEDLEKEAAKRQGSVAVAIPKNDILWPTCGDFELKIMPRRIEDFIKRCWTIDSKWLYTVQLLDSFQDCYRKRHVFEVKFSVPSPTTPVPPATASVYFTIEIPLYSAKNDPVQVSYVLEGHRYTHKPGKIPFQDNWLWGIVSDKLRVQKAISF